MESQNTAELRSYHARFPKTLIIRKQVGKWIWQSGRRKRKGENKRHMLWHSSFDHRNIWS
jgi:hypothetical protein